jgi:hypothetical protein
MRWPRLADRSKYIRSILINYKLWDKGVRAAGVYYSYAANIHGFI